MRGEKITDEEVIEAYEIWKKENPNKSAYDVATNVSVPINNDKTIKLGEKFRNLRRIYAGILTGKMSEKIKEYFENEGLFSGNKIDEKRKKSEKEYREAYEIWEKNNPGKTINDIKKKDKIKIKSGKTVKIGERLHTMKQVELGQKQGVVTEEQRKYWFIEKGLILDNKLDIQREQSEREKREALEKWLEENVGKTINDISKFDQIKISSGKVILLGFVVINLRAAIKKYLLGQKCDSKITEDVMEYWVYEKGLKIAGILLTKGYDNEKIKMRLESFDRLKENLRQSRNDKTKTFSLKENIHIDENRLDSHLGKNISQRKQGLVLMKDGEYLKNYCLKRGYNYNKIYRMIMKSNVDDYKDMDDLIENVIKIYEEKGQESPNVWVYDKGGVLLKHILLFVGVDSSNIVNYINKNHLSLDEAIAHEVFRMNVSCDYRWMEGLYHSLIGEINLSKENLEDILAEKFSLLSKKYGLEKEEYDVLKNVLYKYILAMKKYIMADVGLCRNEDEKIKKITDYNLSNLEIEESLLVELNFYNGVVLGRNSKLYKRRELLRSYIIDWSYYTEIEKKEIIRDNYLSLEELKYIVEKREEIDNTIHIVTEMREKNSIQVMKKSLYNK